MRWPWRALVYAVVALCVVTGVFVLERPWVGVGGLAVGAVAVLLWRVLRRYFSFKKWWVYELIGVALFAALMFAWTNVRWAEPSSSLIPDECNRTLQMMQ